MSFHANASLVHKFLGEGFFDGGETADLVRFMPSLNHDGTAALGLALAAGYLFGKISSWR